MTSRYIIAAAMSAFVCTACDQTTIDLDAEGRAVMELSRHWSDLIATGDLEAGIDFWAEDAVMLPPDLPVLSGKPAIREYVQAAGEIPGFKISWEPIEAHVSSAGDMAYLIERNRIEVEGEDGNPVVTHGKVVTVWRKNRDGSWQNVVDMWNAAPPPAP